MAANEANANAHLQKLQQQKLWLQENEALQSLKRYITNKYN